MLTFGPQAFVAEKHPEIGPEDVINAISIGARTRQVLRNFYNELPPVGRGSSEDAPPRIIPDVLGATIETLQLSVSQLELAHSARLAYETLTRKGLIQDPLEILVGGLLVGVMGLVPVSFTSRTKAGKVVYRKMKAAYWEWEKSERRGITTQKIEFRLLKLLKAFRAGAVSGFKTALQENA
jgi:hypothetical protein